MNILILGNAEDEHAAHIKNILENANVTVEYLDTSLFPAQLKLSWHPHDRQGCLQFPSGRRLDLQDIHSVYWRSFNGVRISKLAGSYQEDIAFRDAMSTVRSLFQACPAHWVNPWQAYQFHQEKPLQLSLARQLGIDIPATLVSNDPKLVTSFAKSYQKIIFKPVYGGTHTRFVTEDHLNWQRLNLALKISPVTLQEYISGTNIRSYVIGESVYSAEIRTEAIDFRDDSQAELIPIDLPKTIQTQCLAIAKAFTLEWTAIDWRKKPTGEYIFLEANPSPMFLYFEQKTGFPITQKLVELLLKN
jgi:glutathione synthase/RimK-type ligase-like ATP-grasp enzyme